MGRTKKIYLVKYVDAYYTYAKRIGKTRLSPHEALGFIAKNRDVIIITFIKERTERGSARGKKAILIRGLVIPDSALLSKTRTFKMKVFKNTKIGSKTAVTWRDIRFVANMPIHDCAVMYTEGTLFRIEKDHVVLKNPETIRIHPPPTINHPTEKPTFYIIPIAFVTKIETTNK